MITKGDEDVVVVVQNRRSRTSNPNKQSNSSMAKNVSRSPKRAKNSKKASTGATEMVNLR